MASFSSRANLFFCCNSVTVKTSVSSRGTRSNNHDRAKFWTITVKVGGSLAAVPNSPIPVGDNVSRSNGLPILFWLIIFQMEQASALSIAQSMRVFFNSPLFSHEFLPVSTGSWSFFSKLGAYVGSRFTRQFEQSNRMERARKFVISLKHL